MLGRCAAVSVLRVEDMGAIECTGFLRPGTLLTYVVWGVSPSLICIIAMVLPRSTKAASGKLLTGMDVACAKKTLFRDTEI